MHRKIMRRSRVIRINLDGVTVFGQVAFINSRIGFQGICVAAERLSTDFVMNQEKLIEACQCDAVTVPPAMAVLPSRMKARVKSSKGSSK